MGSLFKQTLKKPDNKFIDRRINIKTKQRKRSNKDNSPDFFDNDNESERITRDYVKEKYLNKIINKKTAKRVLDSLKKDPKSGLPSDFDNLINGTTKGSHEKYLNFLIKNYGKSNFEKIEKAKVTLNSNRERAGYKLNKKTYLIVVEGKKGMRYVQARSFKTGRAVKLNRFNIK